MITSFFNRTSNAANLFLVLCKPASAYEKECTKEQHAFLLRPFRFFEMRMLYPEMSLEEQMLLYSVTGGVPAYLRFFNPEISVKDNLYRLFFQENGSFWYRLYLQNKRIFTLRLPLCALFSFPWDRRRKSCRKFVTIQGLHPALPAVFCSLYLPIIWQSEKYR